MTGTVRSVRFKGGTHIYFGNPETNWPALAEVRRTADGLLAGVMAVDAVGRRWFWPERRIVKIELTDEEVW